MPGQRVLLPTPAVAGNSRTIDATPGDAEGSIAGQQGRGKERRHRHTVQEWEDVKESFTELYSQEDTSLEKVRHEMKRDYGFEARYVRSFETKFFYFLYCRF